MKTWVSWLMIALTSLSACSTQSSSISTRESPPERLKNEFQTLLDLSRQGDPEPVRLKLEEFLPRAELVQSILRASPQTEGLGELYEKQIKQSALKELPIALIEAHKLGLKEIKISRVSPQSGSTNAPGDLELLEYLNDREGLYTVRLVSPTHPKGLRLNAWLHLGNRGWISLLKLGEHIAYRSHP